MCLISYNTDQYVFLKSYYLLGCRADTGFLFSVFLFKRSCNLVPIVCNGLETLFPWAFVQLICKHLLKMLTKEKNFNLRTSWEVSQHTNMFKTSYSTLKNHRNRSVSSQMFSKNRYLVHLQIWSQNKMGKVMKSRHTKLYTIRQPVSTK